jgi:signal peptidase II
LITVSPSGRPGEHDPVGRGALSPLPLVRRDALAVTARVIDSAAMSDTGAEGDPRGKDGEAAPVAEAPSAPPSYRFLAVVALVGAAIDLASKEWARHVLHGADPIRGKLREIEVIPGLFDLQYAENPGGAWSMLRSLPEIWRRPFFLFVSTAASVFICSLYARVDRRDWAMKWGLPLALAGALGNLVDRVRHGIVVDFLHVYSSWGGKARHWPTFNVADVWIVLGVALMALSILSGKSRLGHAEDDSTDDPDDPEADRDAGDAPEPSAEPSPGDGRPS